MGRIGELVRAARREGVRSAGWRAARFLTVRASPFRARPLSTVYVDDVAAVDWTRPTAFNTAAVPRPADGYRVAWIITPPSRTSGGHQNAFRFMRFLERAGHRLTVFLYAPNAYPRVDPEQVRRMMAESDAYPELDADIRIYDPAAGLGAFDAVVASDWEATYASYRHGGDAKRFYFVQDFEPSFFPVGSDWVVAENSYRLGFHGLAVGRWMAETVRGYGMTADVIEFGIDSRRYTRTNTGRRTDVVFYARSSTPRRATELGLLALTDLHRRRPDIGIHIVGGDMAGVDVAFPYTDHGVLGVAELNELYNRCAAALVLSLTNISLVPFEVMGSGTAPVVNDSPNTRGSLDSEFVEWAPLAPAAIADRIAHVVDRPDQVERSEAMARAIASADWGDAGAAFVRAFEEAMARPA